MLANGKRLHSTKAGTAGLLRTRSSAGTGPYTSPRSPSVRRKSILETVLPILCRRPRSCWIPHPLPLPWVLPIRTQPIELSSPRAAPMRWRAAPQTGPIPPAATLSQTRGLWPSKQGSSKFIWACLNPFRIWPWWHKGRPLRCPWALSNVHTRIQLSSPQKLSQCSGRAAENMSFPED